MLKPDIFGGRSPRSAESFKAGGVVKDLVGPAVVAGTVFLAEKFVGAGVNKLREQAKRHPGVQGTIAPRKFKMDSVIP